MCEVKYLSKMSERNPRFDSSSCGGRRENRIHEENRQTGKTVFELG